MPDPIAEAPEISVVVPWRNEEEPAEAIAVRGQPPAPERELLDFPSRSGADFQPSVSQGPNRFQGR